LERLKQRDVDAVSEIVKAYSTQLFRTSLGLGFDSTVAQDIVQNVWVTFFDVVSHFEGRSHIRTFLFGILYNKAFEMRRDQSRLDTRDPVEDILDVHFDEKGYWLKLPLSPDEILGRTETLELIEKCLKALPLKQKMAFDLKEVQNEETSTICNILDLNPTH